jgi:multiple antibiotic resistance protein
MLEFVPNSFVTPLVVVDPLRLAPNFAALTKAYSEKRKREAAIRGTALGTVLLLIFALSGSVLLEASGISIPAFQIAGGILPYMLALDLIFATPTGLRSRTVREQEEITYEHDVPVFPLAISLLAGPGAITIVLLYSGERSATELVVFGGVLLAVLLLTLASLPAPRIMRLFGETGSNVLTRVLGDLLAALAVQFVLDGIWASLA